MYKKQSTTAFTSVPVGSGRSLPSSKETNDRRLSPACVIAGVDSNEVAGLTRDMLTAASIGAAGDVIAQYSEFLRNNESGKGVDWGANLFDNNADDDDRNFFDIDARRTASYAAFGASYTGGFQHFVFSGLGDAIEDPLLRVVISQGLIIPLCYYPFFYWLVPKLRAKSSEERIELRDNINLRKMIPRNWAFWVPLQYLQFNFVPMSLQVTYVSVVGLIWNILLSSFTAGGNTSPSTAPAQFVDVSNEDFVLPETLMSTDAKAPSNSTALDAPLIKS